MKDSKLELMYKIKRYKRISVHKLMNMSLYRLLKNYVIEFDSNEFDNFQNIIYRPLKINTMNIESIVSTVYTSTSYLNDLLNQNKYDQFFIDYFRHRYLNGLEELSSGKTEISLDMIISDYIEGESHRFFIYIIDNYNEKRLDEIITYLYNQRDTLDQILNPNFSQKVANVFINNLYLLIYCFLYNKTFEEDVPDIGYEVSDKINDFATKNILKFVNDPNTFRYSSDNNIILHYLKINPNDFEKSIEIWEKGKYPLYQKLKDGVDSFITIKYNNKSSNIAKLKEVLLSDYISFPRNTEDYDENAIQKTSNYSYHFFLTSIIHFLMSDFMMTHKHLYDLRRTENKKTFVNTIKKSSKNDYYFIKSHYDLVLKYTNDYKRREGFFIIHLCYYMCITPNEALQISKAIGFYEHKKAKDVLKTFNDDIVILYPNFELLKGTSFFCE